MPSGIFYCKFLISFSTNNPSRGSKIKFTLFYIILGIIYL